MNTAKVKNICVVGLGKLGAPMAAVLANSDFNVIGLDLNQETINQINNKEAPVSEPGLQSYIDNAKERLSATSSYKKAITESDVTFIIVPTPSQSNDLFNIDYVLTAIKQIGHELKYKTDYHLVVISSTVLPGSMDGLIKSSLEDSSGKLIGSGLLGLCYNPEFIALGSVIDNMLKPDITLIGESDPTAGDILESIHNQISLNNPEIHRMNFINAELTKISINTYVTTKISYANMLAELCEQLPGADVNVVTEAVGGDSRIGNKYLTGAIGYAGPCFPRDNKAFAAIGKEVGVNCDIAIATDAINNRQINRMINCITRIVKPLDTIAVLGLSYKIDTCEVDKSQGIALCIRLNEMGFMVKAFDPQANTKAREVLPEPITVDNSLEMVVQNSQIVIVTTPWNDFKSVPAIMKSTSTLIDPWRHCENNAKKFKINYIQMGKCQNLYHK